MELFPHLEIGWFNGWILVVLFFCAYGIMLSFFSKEAMARLYDRSGQRQHQLPRRLAIAILVLLWFVVVSLTPLKIGGAVFAVGISVYSLGLIGFLVALDHYRNTPIDQPVTSGPYRISRNPQQIAVSVAYLGMGIAIGSWAAFAFMILGVIGGHFRILGEEQACLEQYGESYRGYMQRVPRYFLFF